MGRAALCGAAPRVAVSSCHAACFSVGSACARGRAACRSCLLYTSKAALSRAEGDLSKADAALSDAQAVVRRYTPLVKIEAVSQQDFDTATAALKSAQAARRSAQADVETARLNLDYATVKAPISGRIGRAQVTEGALVGQNEATVMAKIQQLDPIYVDFTQPVADMPVSYTHLDVYKRQALHRARRFRRRHPRAADRQGQEAALEPRGAGHGHRGLGAEVLR